MERIDKIIASQSKYSRSEVKKLVKEGLIKLNGETVKASDIKCDGQKDEITVNGTPLFYKKHLYIMLNKPKGVISATEDKNKKTVLNLVPEELYRSGLFPAGRLDSDTTGFVLLTDDGDFAHKILSPKNHVMKTYHATLKAPISDSDIIKFKEGLTLSDGTKCLEAQVKMISQQICEVIICEGKYHQVKRMFASVGNKVLELKRVKMGALPLDENLPEGMCRELTQKEVELIESRD